MKKSMLGFLGFYAMAMQDFNEDMESINQVPEPKKVKLNSESKKEQPIQKGQFHYWFRIDGTFLSEKQGERMLKTDCIFKCFAINDKNAIKKFKKFQTQNKNIKK